MFNDWHLRGMGFCSPHLWLKLPYRTHPDGSQGSAARWWGPTKASGNVRGSWKAHHWWENRLWMDVQYTYGGKNLRRNISYISLKKWRHSSQPRLTIIGWETWNTSDHFGGVSPTRLEKTRYQGITNSSAPQRSVLQNLCKIVAFGRVRKCSDQAFE